MVEIELIAVKAVSLPSGNRHKKESKKKTTIIAGIGTLRVG